MEGGEGRGERGEGGEEVEKEREGGQYRGEVLRLR